MAKYFVYVDAEYYPYSAVVEANSPDLAARYAIELNEGTTYARYDDEPKVHSYDEAIPACAVSLMTDTHLIGTPNRIDWLLG